MSYIEEGVRKDTIKQGWELFKKGVPIPEIRSQIKTYYSGSQGPPEWAWTYFLWMTANAHLPEHLEYIPHLSPEYPTVTNPYQLFSKMNLKPSFMSYNENVGRFKAKPDGQFAWLHKENEQAFFRRFGIHDFWVYTKYSFHRERKTSVGIFQPYMIVAPDIIAPEDLGPDGYSSFEMIKHTDFMAVFARSQHTWSFRLTSFHNYVWEDFMRSVPVDLHLSAHDPMIENYHFRSWEDPEKLVPLVDCFNVVLHR